MRKSPRRGVARPSSLLERRGRRQELVLRLEALEDRALMTATPTATPDVDIMGVTSNTPYGLTPAQVREAYGFSSVSFGKVAGNGAGQTIAIVDAYNDPSIAADLAKFDTTFGIAAPPSLKVVNENGGTALPSANASWDLEISLDVEWAHAIAPGANILLVEANTSGLGDLLAAVNTARSTAGVSVVSMSWGASEFNGEQYLDSYFTTPAGHQGITFVASSGDNGAPSGWPALSSNVLAVGGTTLTLGSGSTYKSETAWSDSGGGISAYESEPGFQKLVQSTGKRAGPDVSYDANPNTGFAVYDSQAYDGQSGWWEVGGTSAGAPQWSALLAIVNQGRATVGLGSLNGAQSAIYSLPSSDFHDIASGSNGEYSAKAGFDEVTGRGSPIANLVINGLIGAVTSGNVSSTVGTALLSTASNKDSLAGGDGFDGTGSSLITVSTSSAGVMQVAQQMSSDVAVAALAQLTNAPSPALSLPSAGQNALDSATRAGSGAPAAVDLGLAAWSAESDSVDASLDLGLDAHGPAAASSRSHSGDSAATRASTVDSLSPPTSVAGASAAPNSSRASVAPNPDRPAEGDTSGPEFVAPDLAGWLERTWSQFDWEADRFDGWTIPAPSGPISPVAAAEPQSAPLASSAAVGLALAGLAYGRTPDDEAEHRLVQSTA